MTFGQVQGDLTAGIWQQIFRDLQQIGGIGQEERPAGMEAPRKAGNIRQGQIRFMKLFVHRVRRDCSPEVKGHEKEHSSKEVQDRRLRCHGEK